MTFRQSIGFSIFILVGLVLLTGGFIYLRVRGVNASEAKERGEVTWQMHISEDLNADGKKETVYLTSYQQGEARRAYISTRDGLFSTRERELSGFEEDLSFCPKKYFTDTSGNTDVCVFGLVGVHSENIQVVRWDDFSTVQFTDAQGKMRPSMTSDVPNFDFDYYNQDQVRIFFDNRDYDQDPLVDIIRTHYYLGNNVFNFSGMENLSNEGQIK